MDLLPPEVYTFVKLTALCGLFAFGALAMGAIYMLYKKFFGPEKALKYRKYFLLANIPLIIVDIILYLIFFK